MEHEGGMRASDSFVARKEHGIADGINVARIVGGEIEWQRQKDVVSIDPVHDGATSG